MTLLKKEKAQILLTKHMIRSLQQGYGMKPCKTKDYDDFPKHSRGVNDDGRCAQCTAWEVIIWLKSHIALIKL